MINSKNTRSNSLSSRLGTFSLLLGAGLALGTLTGCPEEKGVGDTIEDAAEDAKSAVEDAVDGDGPMEKGGEALDNAGENLKDAAEDAKEDIKDAGE